MMMLLSQAAAVTTRRSGGTIRHRRGRHPWMAVRLCLTILLALPPVLALLLLSCYSQTAFAGEATSSSTSETMVGGEMTETTMKTTLTDLDRGVAASSSETTTTAFEILPYQPVAAQSSTVIAGVGGNVRFTVLTSQLIRMERGRRRGQTSGIPPRPEPRSNSRRRTCRHGKEEEDGDGDGLFEDRPTLAFVNRNTVGKTHPPVNFTVRELNDHGGVEIVTDHVMLTYTGVGDGTFAPENLYASIDNGTYSWKYGDDLNHPPSSNLRGTIRTLDMLKNVSLDCRTNDQIGNHCTYGLISRAGWAVVNDTSSPCLDGASDWWTTTTNTTAASDYDPTGRRSNAMLRNVDEEDLYLFAHGHDYVKSLSDYHIVGGSIPLSPRANIGIWFTRWYDYTNRDVRDVLSNFQSRSIPLDIFVLDMNWHTKQNWTGYTFDTHLFPTPSDTLEYIHRRGIKVAVNLHDANGIGTWEDAFLSVSKRLNISREEIEERKLLSIPIDWTSADYIWALEDEVLQRLEEIGVDFFWIDWQQGETMGNTGQSGRDDIPMNPTIWLAKTRSTDPIRRCRQGVTGVGVNTTAASLKEARYLKPLLECTTSGTKRGVVLGRWGGLGHHRYPLGFSGDVDGLTWSNLAYQSYFTTTAVNVAYNMWSHDIVGPGDDFEMYTRWIQLGSVSAIMRSHDRGLSAGGDCSSSWPITSTNNQCSRVQPWNVPEKYDEANRLALRLRSELVPYIYTYVRHAFEGGAGKGLIQPMYYHWPESNGSYPESMDEMLGQTPGTRQYLFGHDLLVAPITGPSMPCHPGSILAPGRKNMQNEKYMGRVTTFEMETVRESPCSLSYQDIWIPPGPWFEIESGRVRDGGTAGMYLRNRGFLLHSIPLFARGGSIISRRPFFELESTLGRATQQYDALEFTIYPCDRNADDEKVRCHGQTRVYEDDGETLSYLDVSRNRTHVWTEAKYRREGRSVRVTVSSDLSTAHPDMVSRRHYSIRLANVMPATNVTVNGIDALFDRWCTNPDGHGTRATYCFDGDDVSVVVHVPSHSTSQLLAVELTLLSTAVVAGQNEDVSGSVEQSPLLDGLKGRIDSAHWAKKNLDEQRTAPGANVVDPAYCSAAASIGDELARLASPGENLVQFKRLVRNFTTVYDLATEEIENGNWGNEGRKQYSLDILHAGRI